MTLDASAHDGGIQHLTSNGESPQVSRRISTNDGVMFQSLSRQFIAKKAGVSAAVLAFVVIGGVMGQRWRC